MINLNGGTGAGMSTPKSKHSAAGPYLGFGLQTVRLCARLLSEAQDSKVFIEHDDDISVHYANGEKLLEQVKSAQKQNPISDWARDLWKCLHNWLEDQSPILNTNPATQFRLFVTPVHEGGFASALSDAQTAEDVADLVEKVKFEAKSNGKTKTGTFKLAKRFLDATLAEQFALAANFRLICQDDPLDEIKQLYRLAVPEQLLNQILSYAIGEAKRQSDILLLAGHPAGLLAGPFQDQIRKFVQRVNLPALFEFNPIPPDPTIVGDTLSGRPTFIQQLELINADKEQQLTAVSDYLRASSDKTNWAAEGILLPNSLDVWDDTLKRRHKAVHQSITSLHAHLKPTSLGMAIYAECRKLDLSLETKSVPDHFTHGCLNDLADRRELGWHPEYATLLDK